MLDKSMAPLPTRRQHCTFLDEFARLAPQESRVSIAGEDLSLREKEVLQLVAQGATNKEIASQLFIAENTVKNHLRNILAKLHVGNRLQAAAYALRQGLMGHPSPEA